MAKKKNIPQMGEEQKMQENLQMLSEIQMMEEQTKVLEQEGYNKSHDVEFNTMADGDLGVIGQAEVEEAYQTLLKYKDQRANLTNKIIENERFWKLNHWEEMADGNDKRIKPKSAWLFNTIINKHADAMDNYPEPTILPRARDDEETAEILSDVIPVVLEQNDFENVYSDVMWYKMKHGTGVYGVFWNSDKSNGLGDIDIEKIKLTNLFWAGGIDDIQDSPNVFLVATMDNEEIEARYPQIKSGNTNLLPLLPQDPMDGERVDQSNKSAVVDWYYRRRVQGFDDNGIPKTQTVLHYCKFCNGQVIYASENDPKFNESGWYAHGKYPFVIDRLYPIESSICGMGYIDIVKDDQMFIDKLRQAILENAVVNARPRYAVREDGGLNEEEFLDLSNPVIHFSGTLGDDSFRQIVASPLAPIYETVLQSMIQEMKDTSGNTASSQGQASRVTSASGIASLQEAAGKLARDNNKASYRAFKDVVDMVIELIRQFYNEPRCFRIAGDRGENQFVDFDNSGLLPQAQESAFGIDLGSRLPIMDIDVRPAKKNAYSKETQNQTALNLYGMGFFAPNNADSSLACLEMMDIDGIEKMKDIISQNGTMYEQIQMMMEQMQRMAQIIDMQNGSNITEQMGMATPQMAQAEPQQKKSSPTSTSKGSLTSQAANASRNSTSPQ